MVLDYGLCGFWTETNSLEYLLALLSFNDIGGDCPDHHIVVWWLVWLRPVLVIWAQGFWVGLLPLVWLAVLFLAAMWGAVTGGVRHGNVWPLVLGLGRAFTRCMTSGWVVSYH